MFGLELPVMSGRFSFPAMGATVEVALLDASDAATSMLRDESCEFVGRLERTWSRFDPASELAHLNTRAGTGPVPAGELLRTAVDAALALWRATDGLFDPTVIDALEWWGYDCDFAQVRSRTTEPLAPQVDPSGRVPLVPTAAGVIVDHERRTITVPAGVRLDLGGVGKGLAADLLAAHLVDRGSAGACVSVGGDIAVAGDHPSGGWSIPVLDPAHGNRVGWHVPITDGALVQSNRVVRSWQARGIECHHIIDPRTGAPSGGELMGVIVRAESAWWAEGVAKAALVAGPVEGAHLIRRLVPAAWMIRDDGSVVLVGDIGIGCAA